MNTLCRKLFSRSMAVGFVDFGGYQAANNNSQ